MSCERRRRRSVTGRPGDGALCRPAGARLPAAPVSDGAAAVLLMAPQPHRYTWYSDRAGTEPPEVGPAPTCHTHQMTPCQMTPCQITPCLMTPCQMTPCLMTPCQMTPCQMTPTLPDDNTSEFVASTRPKNYYNRWLRLPQNEIIKCAWHIQRNND